MTFEEFLTKCREEDGWRLEANGVIRNRQGYCPLEAVFGAATGWTSRAKKAGLDYGDIADAADGIRDDETRKALLTLVKS